MTLRRSHRFATGTSLAPMVVMIAAIAGTALAQPAAQPPVLSLDSAVALARQQNRPLQATRLDVDSANLEIMAFRTQRRPLFDVKVASGTLVAPLSFRFATGVFGTLPTTGPIPPTDVTITTNPRLSTVVFASVIQPLTQLPRIGHGEEAAELGAEVATEHARLQEATLVANVRRLYYAVVQAEAAVRAREESMRFARELLRLTEQYESQRVVLPADVLAARAGVREQEQQAAIAGRAAQGFREQLNAVLGRDLDEPFSVEAFRPVETDDLDLRAAEALAVTARPEVRIGRLQARRAAAALAATKTPGMPDVNLAFEYTGFYGFEVLPQHGALFGVLATWEPWDWGRGKADRERKRILQEQATLAATEAESMVRVDVRARFRALQDAFAMVTVSEAAREVARERLRVATDRFAQDASLQRDVLEAQARLAETDAAREQAVGSYWSARAEFERARADP
jgi:outer membrane protein TolC